MEATPEKNVVNKVATRLLNKRVRIKSGNGNGSTGIATKWIQGWMQVMMDDGSVQHRRCTDLCLLDDNGEEEYVEVAYVAPELDKDDKPVTLDSIKNKDEWVNKRVQFKAGKYIGHKGVTTKWCNGWMEVLLDNGITYCNRASEMVLLDEGPGYANGTAHVNDLSNGSHENDIINNKQWIDHDIEDMLLQLDWYDYNSTSPQNDIIMPYKGLRVEIRDIDYVWSSATIHEVNDENKTIVVQYDGWNSNYNEILPFPPHIRISKIYVHTIEYKCLVDISNFTQVRKDLWPCKVFFRMPQPQNGHAISFLRSERNVFVVPYGKKTIIPKDLKTVLLDNTNNGIWVDVKCLYPFDAIVNSRYKGFVDAVQCAKEDRVRVMPKDVFEAGALVRGKYRPNLSVENEYKKDRISEEEFVAVSTSSMYYPDLITNANRCKYCNTMFPEEQSSAPPTNYTSEDLKSTAEEQNEANKDSLVYALEGTKDCKPTYNQTTPNQSLYHQNPDQKPKKQFGCICNINHEGQTKSFYIQCDDCKLWYCVLEKCLGLNQDDADELDTWNCWDCFDYERRKGGIHLYRKVFDVETSKKNEFASSKKLNRKEKNNDTQSVLSFTDFLTQKRHIVNGVKEKQTKKQKKSNDFLV